MYVFLVISGMMFSKIPGICLAHFGYINLASIFVFDSSWLEGKKNFHKEFEILIKDLFT